MIYSYFSNYSCFWHKISLVISFIIRLSMKVFCIILARGGSKQIKNKNLVKIKSKPMIYYTISQALNSKMVSQVWVSSDDRKILSYSSKLGSKIIKRPSKYASDFSSSESAWLHAIKFIRKIGENPDLILAPQVTSPKRPKGIFDKVIKFFVNKKYDSLMSSNKINPPNIWHKSSGGKLKKKIHNNYIPRQKIVGNYNENGSFYLFKTSKFLKKKKRLFGKIGMYELNKKYELEIDNLDDLKKIQI